MNYRILILPKLQVILQNILGFCNGEKSLLGCHKPEDQNVSK